eukprot:scaffold293242_cov18-Tisochrysis_lutea.AAC.1
MSAKPKWREYQPEHHLLLPVQHGPLYWVLHWCWLKQKQGCTARLPEHTQQNPCTLFYLDTPAFLACALWNAVGSHAFITRKLQLCLHNNNKSASPMLHPCIYSKHARQGSRANSNAEAAEPAYRGPGLAI